MTRNRTLVILAMLTAAFGCGDDDGPTPMPDGGMEDDAGRPDAGPPPTTGCTNANATNFDEEAAVDDGSCTFRVSFAVDMTGIDYERSAGLSLEGSFCSDDCPTLTDADEDEVWEGSADLVIGSYTHAFVLGGTPATVESVPEFCRAAESTRRGFEVTTEALALEPVAFGGCTVLPVVVDGFYAASGFFGDATGITVTESCPERGGDGAGACRTWTYTRGGMGFAGVFWQFPENNFGAEPGFPMPPGATRVSFSAWGAAGGETVKFLVGYGPDSSGARDGFGLETADIALTATPTEYTISVVGIDYDTVGGGFGWVAGLPEGAGPITFYVDDVQWERVPEDLENVPGCTDADASNYAPAATVDNGSCRYPVTFEVDMGCPDPSDAFATVWLTGPFCSFCADGFQLTDPDGDMIFTGTFDFPAGDLEFKFMTNNFASQEDLIDDVAGGMGACAPVTDGASYANRQVAIPAAPTTISAVYGSCASTCP